MLHYDLLELKLTILEETILTVMRSEMEYSIYQSNIGSFRMGSGCVVGLVIVGDHLATVDGLLFLPINSVRRPIPIGFGRSTGRPTCRRLGRSRRARGKIEHVIRCHCAASNLSKLKLTSSNLSSFSPTPYALLKYEYGKVR